MQNPSYTYDEYLICIGLGPSISSVICKYPSYSGPSYPSSPVLEDTNKAVRRRLFDLLVPRSADQRGGGGGGGGEFPGKPRKFSPPGETFSRGGKISWYTGKNPGTNISMNRRLTGLKKQNQYIGFISLVVGTLYHTLDTQKSMKPLFGHPVSKYWLKLLASMTRVL